MSNNTSITTTTTQPSPTDLLAAEARNAIESTKAETIKSKQELIMKGKFNN